MKSLDKFEGVYKAFLPSNKSKQMYMIDVRGSSTKEYIYKITCKNNKMAVKYYTYFPMDKYDYIANPIIKCYEV
ncbi:MAG TPA: hypothetical protein HA255_03280 [Methanosphaera sp.]|nr:hypothetical protein [Methanosphaera sp.]